VWRERRGAQGCLGVVVTYVSSVYFGEYEQVMFIANAVVVVVSISVKFLSVLAGEFVVISIKILEITLAFEL
jgi:hypothetical protein